MKKVCILLVAALLLMSCGEPNKSATVQDPVPLHDSFSIVSIPLAETRLINIWTPPGYEGSTDPLPVLYMADGGIKEDFSHIANTLDELIAAKKIDPVILVGIENTQRRRDLSPPTSVAKDREIAPVVGGSAKFRDFIKEELMPQIERRYRTTDKNGIIGESLSGLFVMETFFLTPEIFDYYIAFDPSLWWNDHGLVRKAKEHLAKMPATDKVLWFAGSEASDISVHTRSLATELASAELPQLRWTYADEPEEKHNTIFRATKEKALIWAFGRN